MSMEILFLQGVTLGQRVRIARMLKRWRQSDLAEFAGVSQANVSALERDCPVYPAARQRLLDTLGLEDPHG